MIAKGAVPAQMRIIRTFGIPEEDGGQRYLGIASIIWRIFMSVTSKKHDAWVDAVVPPEMVGCLHARRGDELHEVL